VLSAFRFNGLVIVVVTCNWRGRNGIGKDLEAGMIEPGGLEMLLVSLSHLVLVGFIRLVSSGKR
jgi:hypothetical protein